MVAVRIVDIDLANLDVGDDGDIVGYLPVAQIRQKRFHFLAAEREVLDLDRFRVARPFDLDQMHRRPTAAIVPGTIETAEGRPRALFQSQCVLVEVRHFIQIGSLEVDVIKIGEGHALSP